MNKLELRKKISRIRKKNYFKNLSINVVKFLKILEKNKNKNNIIGGYYPFNYEIDTLNILKLLEQKNYKISLPKIGKNNLMNFYSWSYKDPLSINTYGIPEPVSKKKVYPNILLVPLLAFDKELNGKKIITIGMSYSLQKIKKLPINQYDMKLDHVATEKKFF